MTQKPTLAGDARKTKGKTKMSDKAIVLDTPAQIEGYRLCSLKAVLSLEVKGLRFRRSVYARIKREFGFKGNKKSVLAQLETHIAFFNAKHFPKPQEGRSNEPLRS